MPHRQSQAISAAGSIGLEAVAGKHGNRCKCGWSMPENRFGIVVSSATTIVRGTPKTYLIKIQMMNIFSLTLVRRVAMMAADLLILDK